MAGDADARKAGAVGKGPLTDVADPTRDIQLAKGGAACEGAFVDVGHAAKVNLLKGGAPAEHTAPHVCDAVRHAKTPPHGAICRAQHLCFVFIVNNTFHTREEGRLALQKKILAPLN